jgi:hypothetical protein
MENSRKPAAVLASVRQNHPMFETIHGWPKHPNQAVIRYNIFGKA